MLRPDPKKSPADKTADQKLLMLLESYNLFTI